MAKKKIQNTENLPLVAIDLGSHSVRAMAAVSLGGDMLHILGAEQSSKHPCIQNGVVQNSSDTAYMINEVLKLLANQIDGVSEIPSVFVVMGGKSMQIKPIFRRKDLIRERNITPDLLEKTKIELINDIEKQNPGTSVLDLIPAYYVLDGKEQDETPQLHQRATILEPHYYAFIGKKELKQKVQDSFVRAAKYVESSFVRTDALLSAFAAENTNLYEDGCAVIDMGAQTTTICVYKGNQYLATNVVPLGGWHITRYIEQIGISINTAEELKCKYGCACPELTDPRMIMKIKSVSQPGQEIKISATELAENIRMKLDEIMFPIFETLKPFEDRIKTVYITGGASMLCGMTEYIQARTKLEVMYGSHAPLLDNQTDEEFYKPEYTSLVGALIMGADYRSTHKLEIPTKANRINEILSADSILKFFTDSGE